MCVGAHKAKIGMLPACGANHLLRKIHADPQSWPERSQQITAGTTEFEDRSSRRNDGLVNLSQPSMVVISPTSPVFQFARNFIPMKRAGLLIVGLSWIHELSEHGWSDGPAASHYPNN